MQKSEKGDQSLTKEQIAAITRQVKLGKILQQTIPQISKDYKAGFSASEILEKYNLKERFLVTNNLTLGAIRYALQRYKGGLQIEEYGGMLTKEESKLEIYGRTKTKHCEDSKKGGNKTYELKKGIHGSREEEKYTIKRRGSLVRGQVLGKKCMKKKRNSWTEQRRASCCC